MSATCYQIVAITDHVQSMVQEVHMRACYVFDHVQLPSGHVFKHCRLLEFDAAERPIFWGSSLSEFIQHDTELASWIHQCVPMSNLFGAKRGQAIIKMLCFLMFLQVCVH